MPFYLKFLKDLLSNKGKTARECYRDSYEECSAIIQSKLSPKL